MQWFSTMPSFQTLLGIAEDPPAGLAVGRPDGLAAPAGATVTAPAFAPGTLVEYNSASQGTWIPAKVLSIRPDGTYDLDCKPAVHHSKIRLPNLAPLEFEIGSMVEYLSESQGGWILARVQGFNARLGLYDLDCKPQVHPSKIRKVVDAKVVGRVAPGSRAPEVGRSALGSIPESREVLGSSEVLGEARSPARGSDSIDITQPVHHFQPPSRTDLPAMPGPTFQEERGGSSGSRSPSPSRSVPPTTLPGHTGDIPVQDGPLQLVKVTRRGSGWHFEVDEQAAKVLEAYGQRRIAICTVCGPYRTGKSYLLNLLLGRIQRGHGQFRVGYTTRACTEGIWMWGTGDAGSDNTGIIFMDCEGFGSVDSDRLRDAKLMSLCVLISSIFLLNTKGVLNEGLFNALSLVCNMAEHVEEPGQEASKPALLWLLRDFILELRDEADMVVTSDQYLEQALHARPLASSDAARSQAARDVRDCLLRFFPQRHCQTLVQPLIDEDKLRELSEVPYEHLRPEFRKEFEAMQAKLLNLARARPKTIGGQPVTAVGLVGLLRRLVDALNQDNVLSVGSAWDQVQNSCCAALVEELSTAFAAELEKVREGGPLPVPGGQPLPVMDDVLAQALKEGRRMLRQEFRARAVGDEAVRASYWQELRGAIADREKALVQLNEWLAEEQLRTAGAQWETWLGQEGNAVASDSRSEALALLLSRGMPGRPACRAAVQAVNASRMARIRWDGSADALKAELKLVNDDLASKVASIQAQAAAKFDDSQLEQVREVGRLKGQVEQLQEQARESIQREKLLKQQVLEAEEATRREHQGQAEVQRNCLQLQQTIRDLENQVADLRQQAEDLRRQREELKPGLAARGTQPKCTCAIM